MNATTILVTIALLTGAEPPPTAHGYLSQPSFELDKSVRLPMRPYAPQAGDIILESDNRLAWTIGHRLAKTGHPHHSSIVFERPDGSLATLQAGGYEPKPSKVGLLDLMQHLGAEDAKTGRRERRVWIRSRSRPLTPQQSAALTQYAMEVEGKRFARGRLFLLMTPYRAKGPVRTAVFGKPDLDRESFFCSEMAASALVAAGVLDAELTRPGAMFPQDFFLGTCRNRHVDRGLKPLNAEWDPPARWLSVPIDVSPPE